MANVSNVLNYIDERVPINFSYNTIKNRINVDKYIVKEKYKINYRLMAVAFSLILVFVTSLSVLLKETKIEYLSSNIQLFYTDTELVNSYNNIFVAKVSSVKETKYNKNNTYNVPYTYYEINVVDSLKGSIDKNTLLCFYGGKKAFKEEIYLKENNELIKENEYYLFFTYQNGNDLVLSQNNQKVILDDFDESLPLGEQTGNCRYLLKRFINIINKQIGNERWYISSPVLPPKNELASIYDYNSIIKINNKIPVDLYTYGEGSDVATMFYNIETIESFKNESYEGNLCCFGVDYWKKENVSYSIDKGLDILDDNTVYFMISNKKSNDKNKDRIKNNQRIKEEDYIIEGNYQLIKLDNYDCNKSFDKQSSEIKSIINEYF